MAITSKPPFEAAQTPDKSWCVRTPTMLNLQDQPFRAVFFVGSRREALHVAAQLNGLILGNSIPKQPPPKPLSDPIPERVFPPLPKNNGPSRRPQKKEK